MSPLLADWRRLAGQGLTHRAIAARLALSEAELVARGCGTFCTRLVADAPRLFQAATRLGPIKLVARNDDAVLERTGAVRHVRFDGAVLEVEGGNFRLVAETAQIGSIYALDEERPRGIKRSIALYDRRGASIAKLILRAGSDVAAYERLCASLRHPEQAAYAPGTAPEPAVPGPPPDAVRASLADFLASAVARATPLAITVRNDAARLETEAVLQHVRRSARAPWINVLDPGLDLHLCEAGIALLAGDRTREGAVLRWLAADGREAFVATVREPLDRLLKGSE